MLAIIMLLTQNLLLFLHFATFILSNKKLLQKLGAQGGGFCPIVLDASIAMWSFTLELSV